MKRFLLCLIINTALYATGPYVLQSPALEILDGKFIKADHVELMRKFQRRLLEILKGKKEADGRCTGLFTYQNTQMTLHELALMETESADSTTQKALEHTLAHAKEYFISVSEEFARAGRGPKQLTAELVKESCALRHRSDSLLIHWAHAHEQDEHEVFDRHVQSFKQYEAFCIDLLNFFGDMVHSCPKAVKLFEQRVEKWGLLRKHITTAFVGSQASSFKAHEHAFMRFLKIKHLDALHAREISDEKIRELFHAFLKEAGK